MTSKKFSLSSALLLGLTVGFALAVSPACTTKNPTSICSVANCPTGCCDDVTQECYLGTSPENCGIGGATCQACNASSQACVAGNCRLLSDAGTGGGNGDGTGGGSAGGTGGGSADAGHGDGACESTCAGCCSASNLCITANQNFANCGKGGQSCAACASGNACVQGACIAAMCDLCRDPTGNCRGGPTDSDYCGADGGVCVRCNTANGETCSAGKCVGTVVQCTSANCADGCCSGSFCVRPDGGNPNAQCGLSGAVCQTCSNATCESGICVSPTPDGGTSLPGLDGGLPGLDCDSSNCPDGCCEDIGVGSICTQQGSSGIPGIEFCGLNGAACSTCTKIFGFGNSCNTGTGVCE